MCREYIKTNIRDSELFRTFIAVSDVLDSGLSNLYYNINPSLLLLLIALN